MLRKLNAKAQRCKERYEKEIKNLAVPLHKSPFKIMCTRKFGLLCNSAARVICFLACEKQMLQQSLRLNF
jgi:hypothetical protein